MKLKDRSITLKEWYNSIKGAKVEAIHKLDDPLPGIIDLLFFFTSSLNRSLKKILLFISSSIKNNGRRC